MHLRSRCMEQGGIITQQGRNTRSNATPSKQRALFRSISRPACCPPFIPYTALHCPRPTPYRKLPMQDRLASPYSTMAIAQVHAAATEVVQEALLRTRADFQGCLVPYDLSWSDNLLIDAWVRWRQTRRCRKRQMVSITNKPSMIDNNLGPRTRIILREELV